MKFLIAGLGNPGNEYAETRHNIGFDVLDVFAARHAASFRSARLADVAEIKFKGKIIVLIKPQTFMNLSGRAVKYWIDKEKIDLQQLLVIADELAFDIDKLKIKKSGSDAGHNGLKSIHENLGTMEYARLRFGIGNQFSKGRQSDYVLGKWRDDEIPVVNKKVEACCNIIESFVTLGPDRTMTQFNQMKFIP